MCISTLQTLLVLLCSAIPVFTQSPSAKPTPGYPSDVPSTVSNTSLSFGSHYAVLNLDLINGLVGSMNSTAAGRAFIKNTATWINTVHQQTPPPISIFTRIYFSGPKRPEVGPTSPFQKTSAGLGNVTESSPIGQIYPAFKPLQGWDVELPKTGYYAGTGNSLEQILSAQKIDTVILVRSVQFPKPQMAVATRH
jgi:Isochorismatase family